MDFPLAKELHNHRNWFLEVDEEKLKEEKIVSKDEIEAQEEDKLMEKIGFQFYGEEVRNFYRQYIQSLISPIEKLTDKLNIINET